MHLLQSRAPSTLPLRINPALNKLALRGLHITGPGLHTYHLNPEFKHLYIVYGDTKLTPAHRILKEELCVYPVNSRLDFYTDLEGSYFLCPVIPSHTVIHESDFLLTEDGLYTDSIESEVVYPAFPERWAPKFTTDSMTAPLYLHFLNQADIIPQSVYFAVANKVSGLIFDHLRDSDNSLSSTSTKEQIWNYMMRLM